MPAGWRNQRQRHSSEFSEHIILSGDTAVACGHRILPKAEDDDCKDCLTRLSGRRHRVYGAVSDHARWRYALPSLRLDGQIQTAITE